MIQEYCILLFLINRLVNYYLFNPNFLFFKTFDSEFSYIEVWFTDQNSNLIEIKDKINVTHQINKLNLEQKMCLNK